MSTPACHDQCVVDLIYFLNFKMRFSTEFTVDVSLQVQKCELHLA